MKKSFLHVAILLLFSISWGSAYALDNGYNAHEVDSVQSDALVSLYDKSTATIDSDSLDGAVFGHSINRPKSDGFHTTGIDNHAAFAENRTGSGSSSVGQTDYGSWRYQS